MIERLTAEELHDVLELGEDAAREKWAGEEVERKAASEYLRDVLGRLRDGKIGVHEARRLLGATEAIPPRGREGAP